MNYLVMSAILGLVHIFLQSASTTAHRGMKWNAGPRDEPQAPLTGVAGRLSRAQSNFMESFPLFVAAFLALSIQDRQAAPLAQSGAAIYFYARLVYIPLYAAGVPYIRSLAWVVSIIGIVMMIVSAL